MLALGGEIDAVVEIAGDHIGAAADHGLERLRAALEVDDLDIDAGLLEFAELLGQHGRQIAQAQPPPTASVTLDCASARPDDSRSAASVVASRRNNVGMTSSLILLAFQQAISAGTIGQRRVSA